MTTRVLVTSDTHLELGARLPTALLELADRADHVVHAGDAVRLDVLDTLEALAPLTCVHGNVDDMLVRLKHGARAEVELDGVRIGVIHDGGHARGRAERLLELFPECHVVVYGHSHMPELAWLEDRAGQRRLVVNPGSPTQRRRAPSHTACWLELRDGEVVAADLVTIDS